MKEYSLDELSKGLSEGRWTSLDLVKMYISRINQYDQDGPKINSIAEINPDVYDLARLLDEERKNKGPRSLMHGIPILIKDNILTHDRMHTTAGSVALKDYYGTEDAFIIKKLRQAGAIILGKTNLSEFAYFMSFDDMPSGYGGLSGQVKSPYSHNIDPLGSSTGSAVSVACNFIPVAIGTETNGSLTAPALMNSIQTIKPSMGMVSRQGIIPISHHQDIAGPMARNIEDLAILLDYMYGYDPQDLATHKIQGQIFNFRKVLYKDLDNKRIGFMRFTNLDYSKEEDAIEKQAKEVLRQLGYEIIELEEKAQQIPNYKSLIYDFKVDLNYFMNTYMKNYHLHSLKDIIEYNLEDPQIRMKYGQSIFETSEKTSGKLIEKEYHQYLMDNLEKASLMSHLLDQHDLISITSIKRTSYAPIAGNPVVGVVAKALTDNHPKSLYFIGKKYSDDLVLKVAYDYEQATNKRLAPNLDQIS